MPAPALSSIPAHQLAAAHGGDTGPEETLGNPRRDRERALVRSFCARTAGATDLSQGEQLLRLQVCQAE
jgi:hypothetical protein